MLDVIEFFKTLQCEMKTQDTDYQASPRFWTVGYYKWERVADGCGDRWSIFDGNNSEMYDAESFRKDFLSKLDVMKSDGLSNEEILKEWGLSDESYALDDLKYSIDDDYEFCEWYKNYIDEEIDIFEEAKVHHCNNDAFFLTKSECQKHIDANHYHYLEPHTYARTLFRSPTMEKLIGIIEETDWDRVKM